MCVTEKPRGLTANLRAAEWEGPLRKLDGETESGLLAEGGNGATLKQLRCLVQRGVPGCGVQVWM